MLGRAVIGLQPGEAQMRRRCDLLCQRECRAAGCHSAAAGAHIDFHQYLQLHAGTPGAGIQLDDVAGIVGAYQHPRAAS